MEFSKHCLELYRNLNSSKFSRDYLYHPTSKIFEGHCAHFVAYLIKQCIDPNIQIKDNAKNTISLINYLNNHYQFKEIQQIKEITPGAIITWRKKQPPRTGDTGHCALILNITEAEKNYYHLDVLDCSKLAHDFDEHPRPGVSKGRMKVKVKNDQIIAVIWSSIKKKEKYCDIKTFQYLDNEAIK